MARPQTVSDEEILLAARRVISSSGYDRFTLSEVAKAVGLSRAAIILRFKSTHALKIALIKHMTAMFQDVLDRLPVFRSGDGLLVLVGFIGEVIAERDRLAGFMQSVQSDLNDAELLALEVKRVEVLRKAISDRMPEVGIDHQSAVIAFDANLGGSIMQWQVEKEVSAFDFLVERTRAWLSLVGIEYSQGPIELPITPPEDCLE